MKAPAFSKPVTAGTRRARRTQAFTVTEMMVAVFIFVFMAVGVIYAMIFGMRYDELVCSKLGASDKSRMSFDLLTGDIRAAKWWKVGTGNDTTFTAIGNATNQIGNAIMLSASGDTNSTAYIVYYFDNNLAHTNGGWLCRRSNGVAQVQIVAQFLTNSGNYGNGTTTTNTSMTFEAQKFDGTPALDWQYKYLIVTTMEFCQYQYPLTLVGPNYYYNYYRIQLKAASHCPN
jgi:hypothetical protein